MATWLYQLTQGNFEPEEYRVEVWENAVATWPAGRISRLTQDGEPPAPGDKLLFFYARSGGAQWGFCGWAVVMNWRELEKLNLIDFRAAAPSDQLKMHPWSGDDVTRIVKKVRKGMAQGTLFAIDDDVASEIAGGMLNWVYSRVE
jgi:hypothetical protein